MPTTAVSNNFKTAVLNGVHDFAGGFPNRVRLRKGQIDDVRQMQARTNQEIWLLHGVDFRVDLAHPEVL